MPIGTSTRPVCCTLPPRAKTLVPALLSVPVLANQAAPLRMMGAMLANVSTLLSTLGLPQRPLTAGNGGRGRGSPRLPSIEVMRAVSSPQTKAPDPMRISRSKSKPDPMMSLPRRP